jgi:hypothetical protein
MSSKFNYHQPNNETYSYYSILLPISDITILKITEDRAFTLKEVIITFVDFHIRSNKKKKKFDFLSKTIKDYYILINRSENCNRSIHLFIEEMFAIIQMDKTESFSSISYHNVLFHEYLENDNYILFSNPKKNY